jgi:uncharacterized protein (DUF2249 family)
MIISLYDHRRPHLGPDLDLRGLEFHDRRDLLFKALHALAPGEALRVTTDRGADLTWLRLESEMRCTRRFGWSMPESAGDPEESSQVMVRCAPTETWR